MGGDTGEKGSKARPWHCAPSLSAGRGSLARVSGDAGRQAHGTAASGRAGVLCHPTAECGPCPAAFAAAGQVLAGRGRRSAGDLAALGGGLLLPRPSSQAVERHPFPRLLPGRGRPAGERFPLLVLVHAGAQAPPGARPISPRPVVPPAPHAQRQAQGATLRALRGLAVGLGAVRAAHRQGL